MPKTLAALPSSQYATVFELVWGKNDRGLIFSDAASEARNELEKNDRRGIVLGGAGPIAGLARAEAYLLNVALAVAWRGLVWHRCWHANRRRVNDGASARSMRIKLLPACMAKGTCCTWTSEESTALCRKWSDEIEYAGRRTAVVYSCAPIGQPCPILDAPGGILGIADRVQTGGMEAS